MMEIGLENIITGSVMAAFFYAGYFIGRRSVKKKYARYDKAARKDKG